MRRGSVTVLRCAAVLAYALVAWLLGRDGGLDADRFIGLVIVGVVLFVLVVAADWVNGARRREW